MAAVTYDRESDVVYVALAPEGSDTQGEEVHPGVVLMFDGDERLVGIEILPASQILAPAALNGLPLPRVLRRAPAAPG
jgi:uncharacterized protein YuzE